MAVSFEAFFWAISTQESGGNYRAVGPSVQGGHHAYGKYQVMDYNIPSWTKKYLGRSMTPSQFLASPKAQEAVARGVLKGYFNKYGAKGAAAMWYSGQSNPNKTYGNPPVYKYVASVLGHAGRYTGGGGAGATSTYTAAPPVKVTLSREELAEQYGLTSALINSSKELKSLFNQAVSGGWSAAKFQASLKNSKWWKTQSSSLRKYLTTRYTDPATWKQNWSNTQYKVNALAVQVGLGNQIQKDGHSSKLLRSAIYNSLALGWSDARIKDWLGARTNVKDGDMWGEAGEAFDKLHEVAYLNGLRYGGTWMRDAARAVASGKQTVETYEGRIRNTAAAKWKGFSEQIRAGQNALDLAAPYIKSLSTLLEVPETDVDLFNKHVDTAMTKGTALWQFENDVRSDPLWRKTNNARESMMTVAHQVAKDFGMAW